MTPGRDRLDFSSGAAFVAGPGSASEQTGRDEGGGVRDEGGFRHAGWVAAPALITSVLEVDDRRMSGIFITIG